jgi:hypothetical protein
MSGEHVGTLINSAIVVPNMTPPPMHPQRIARQCEPIASARNPSANGSY